MKKSNNPYNDKTIIIFLLPIISFIITLIGSDYDFKFISSLRFLYLVFVTFLEVLFVFGSFRLVIDLLDKYMPINKGNTKKRLFFQLLISLFAFFLLRVGIYYFENTVLGWSDNIIIIVNSELPIDITFIILINLLYLYWGHMAYTSKMEKENLVNYKSHQPSPQPNYIEIKKSKQTLYLEFNEVAYIYKSNAITYLKTKANETHIINYSLSDLKTLLGSENYYRVNRQFLINQSSIRSYKVLPNRQVQISLIPTSEIDCKLNKNNFKNFKEWLTTHNGIIQPE